MNEVNHLIQLQREELEKARRRTATRKRTKYTPLGRASLDIAMREMRECLCNHCNRAFGGKKGWDCIDISPCPDMLRLVGRLAHFKEMGE